MCTVQIRVPKTADREKHIAVISLKYFEWDKIILPDSDHLHKIIDMLTILEENEIPS